jgi:ABC-2 type transport system ATP-binding protein
MSTISIPYEALKAQDASEMFPTTVVSMRGVTKRYGSVPALDNLSLDLYAGEVVALLGPNGAGKTTAVRLLLGLLSPSEGSIRVQGRDPRERLARIRTGAMLQVSKVPETLKVREHIDLFRSYYPQPLSAAEVVSIAGLDGLENRLFGKLSGGQKQRVLFGLACCGDPDLVFLDEPTVGMDIETRRGLWDQVRSLARQGKTVLLTTHYLEEADALASRVVVLNHGRIAAQGTPAEIKAEVSGRRIRCVTKLDAELLREMVGVTSVEKDRDATVVFTSQAEVVAREMLTQDSSLHNLEITSAGLEDAFLALTGNAHKSKSLGEDH